MFSFQIGVASQEEEVSSAKSATLLEDVKAKLLEVLSLLNQDIGQLFRDAKPIRTILEALEGCNTRFTKGHKPSNHIHARIKSHVYITK